MNVSHEEIKDTLWELYSSWIQESADSVDADTIRDMLLFYERMRQFIREVYEYSQYLDEEVLENDKR